jgi:HEPN domain-containing protein
MKRKDFQLLAEQRLKDARLLLAADRYSGAYYLAGYAIECALKACIARQIARFTFPDKGLATEVYTHDLAKLIRAAGLQQTFEVARKGNTGLNTNWAVVKDWNEAARYRSDVTGSLAKDMITACGSRKVGVLAWLKMHW